MHSTVGLCVESFLPAAAMDRSNAVDARRIVFLHPLPSMQADVKRICARQTKSGSAKQGHAGTVLPMLSERDGDTWSRSQTFGGKLPGRDSSLLSLLQTDPDNNYKAASAQSHPSSQPNSYGDLLNLLQRPTRMPANACRAANCKPEVAALQGAAYGHGCDHQAPGTSVNVTALVTFQTPAVSQYLTAPPLPLARCDPLPSASSASLTAQAAWQAGANCAKYTHAAPPPQAAPAMAAVEGTWAPSMAWQRHTGTAGTAVLPLHASSHNHNLAGHASVAGIQSAVVMPMHLGFGYNPGTSFVPSQGPATNAGKAQTWQLCSNQQHRHQHGHQQQHHQNHHSHHPQEQQQPGQHQQQQQQSNPVVKPHLHHQHSMGAIAAVTQTTNTFVHPQAGKRGRQDGQNTNDWRQPALPWQSHAFSRQEAAQWLSHAGVHGSLVPMAGADPAGVAFTTLAPQSIRQSGTQLAGSKHTHTATNTHDAYVTGHAGQLRSSTYPGQHSSSTAAVNPLPAQLPARASAPAVAPPPVLLELGVSSSAARRLRRQAVRCMHERKRLHGQAGMEPQSMGFNHYDDGGGAWHYDAIGIDGIAEVEAAGGEDGLAWEGVGRAGMGPSLRG